MSFCFCYFLFVIYVQLVSVKVCITYVFGAVVYFASTLYIFYAYIKTPWL